MTDLTDLKIKMLNWANRFSIFCMLDNNGYRFEDPAFECLLGVGCVRSYSFTETQNLAGLQAFFDASPSWLFGHLGYNATGNAYKKQRTSEIDFGRGFFFEPETVIRFAKGKLEVIKSAKDKDALLDEIYSVSVTAINESPAENIQTPSRENYVQSVKNLQRHIQQGDCYEINYCLKFLSDHVNPNPIKTYLQLSTISPAPFGALYKLNDKYCLCASPERFLQKTGRQLISQPIKGTAKRDTDNIQNDEALKHALQHSTKEKSENVMVVDLVRNDLSMVCEKNSVHVKELFGVYTFPQVFQMISTVEGTLASGKNFTDAIAACYPMGSMTGAPKKRVMELIEQYENYDRGLFSGSIGYINPDADFDFNVVIRSVFLDATKKILSFFAGSGITFYSDAADEYDECLAKANAIMQILNLNRENIIENK